MKKVLLGLGIYGVFGAGMSYGRTQLISCTKMENGLKKSLSLDEVSGKFYFNVQILRGFVPLYEKDNEALERGITFEGLDGEIITKIPFYLGVEYSDHGTKITFSKEECKYNQ